MAKVSRIAAFWKAFFTVLLGATFSTAATRSEVDAWQSASTTNTVDAYYQYLSQFPAGEYVDQAINALGALGAIGSPRRVERIDPVVPPSVPKKAKVGVLY